MLAELDGEPVLLRDGQHRRRAFHPELTDDTRVHERSWSSSGGDECPGIASGHSIKHKKGAADARRGQALLQAVARDHRRGARGRGRSRRQPRPPERDREGALVLDAEGHHRAGDRPRSRAPADGAAYEHVTYEGYGPGGVAVFVEALTDNRNRTAAEVRHVFAKHGGNLGESGSGSLAVRAEGRRARPVEVRRGRAHARRRGRGAEDGRGRLELPGHVAPEDLESVRARSRRPASPIESAQPTMVPKTTFRSRTSRPRRRSCA